MHSAVAVATACGSTPATKFDGAGTSVSGTPSPSVSTFTVPVCFTATLAMPVGYAQNDWLPGPRLIRFATSRRSPLPETGVKTSLTLRSSGAT